VAEISEETIARDHKFWKDYSQRTIGDWINYDTSINEICDFCDKVYVTHDYSGFKGNPTFIRDEDAQKSFSKLRNAIGSSIYLWRADNSEAARRNPEVRARMLKEAEFALKQSLAFCPYNVEPLMHLMVMYSNQGRLDDMRRMLQTAHKLDPHSDSINNWMEGVERVTADTAAMRLGQAQQLIQAGKAAEAEPVLDAVANDPRSSVDTLFKAAVAYTTLGQPGKGAAVMQRLVESNAKDWELWLALARMRALDGKAGEAAAALGRAFALNSSDRMTNQPLTNLHDFVRRDPSFDKIRQTPEFQKAAGAK
jgi:tetratricopeptide (TPR) repeat protein